MSENIPAFPPLHRFDHQAMATTYEICFPGGDARYARQVAGEAFRLVDELELKLSRFIENSDVTAINRMGGRGLVPVSIQTLECLRVARAVSGETGGAFDVTVGSLLDCWRPKGKVAREPDAEAVSAARARIGMNLLTLDEERFMAGLTLEGAELDMGAIGKGYAVDQVVNLLREWEIEAAVVHGGTSTIYALGAPEGHEGWPLGVGFGMEEDDPRQRQIVLRDMALSASGTEMQGEHILDPRTGYPPRDRCLRAWSINPSATVSDALSTAFMVLRSEEVDALCHRFGDVGAMMLEEVDGHRRLVRFGIWPAIGM